MKINYSTVSIDISVNIPAPWGGQSFSISEDELAEYQKNPDRFVANKFGVTTDHYRRWAELILQPQCCATTQKGTRCLIPIVNEELEGIKTPDLYNPNGHYLCHKHND